jgi:hypothetical protein
MLQHVAFLIQQDKKKPFFIWDVTAFLEGGKGVGDQFLCQVPKIYPKKIPYEVLQKKMSEHPRRHNT